MRLPNRLPNLVFSALLLCLICQPAAAQTGSKSALKSDLAATRKLAEQGDAEAQYNLGVLYDLGHGVPQDDTQAALWYRKAAEQGYAYAQNNLGVLYDLGHGVPQDDTQAALWFRKAAEQGSAEAQYNLGVDYHDGHGVPQDDTQAALWYRKAAEQGYAYAQYNLGVDYHDGHGVPQDDAEAYFWLDLAASGKVDGTKQEDMDALRDEIAKRLPSAERSRVQERAKKWFEAHPVQEDTQ